MWPKLMSGANLFPNVIHWLKMILYQNFEGIVASCKISPVGGLVNYFDLLIDFN